ncbi:MAG: FmdB family zinc ribbon protein [Polyangiaceae bacterium]|jgi:putative FmdB family regulatory protein
MPTYEYACSSCGNAWEEVQRITEDPVQICPSCKKATAKRQISGGTFILKGGGWYSDLYSSPKSPAAKDDSAKASGEGGKSDKSDSKSETKTESKTEKAETKTESETKKKSEPKKDGGSSSSGSGGSSGPAAGGSSGSSGTSKAAAAG